MSAAPITATIRPYQPSDQAQIEWLFVRTPNAGRVAWRPQMLPDDLRQISETFASFWVAVEPIPEGEAVVGITAVADATLPLDVPVPEVLTPTEPAARLHHVAVAPERWRHGIGRRLILTAADWAREHGYRSVILNTPPDQEAAVALYEATGFTTVGRYWFGPYESVWFRLTL